MHKPPQHILVIRLSAMGDVAMAVPVLRAFTKQYPNVRLTVLTKAFFAPFFRDIPNVSVLAAEVKGAHKGVLGLYKLSKQIRALGVDAIADLHNVLRSNIIKYLLWGLPFEQIDKGRAEKKALVSGRNFKPLKSSHQRYADVFKALGCPVDLSQPIFPKPVVLSPQLQAEIPNPNLTTIGVAPFAAYSSKMYGLEQLQVVIRDLSKDYNILLFGSQTEQKQLQAFESISPNVKNLAGRLTLNEELDVISNLQLMIAMDSGNGHIAAMLGVKVLTIWGVTHPYAGFIPFNQPLEHSLIPDREHYPLLPTSVYGKDYPEDYKNVASSITPDTVIITARNMIK